MKTYIFIHGGESFSTEGEYLDWITTTGVEWNLDPYIETQEKKKWKIEIAKKATQQGNLAYMPDLPNRQNAKYSEWKLFFDAWISQIQIEGDLILIGSSLGGCFLLKYFSEIKNHPSFLSKISEIHLIASCISVGDFSEVKGYDLLKSFGEKVHIWHAEDDKVVPFAVGKELAQHLVDAQTHFFGIEKGYGHFNKVEEFKELEEILGYK